MDIKQVKRILVPTDFSEAADEALETAVAMARAFSAELELLHVTASVVMLPPPFDLVSVPSVFPDVMRKVQEGLDSRAARLRGQGVTATTLTLEGNAHVEIVRHARETGADLIVMATHGRSGIAHAVMGSVAERVVQRAECPVLIVPVRRR